MANPGLSFRTPAAVVVNAAPADSMWDAPPADGTLAEFGGTLFVRTAGAWVAQIGAGDLLAANNLSDVANAAAAAHNLGLGTADSPTFTTLTLSGSGASTVLLNASANKSIQFFWGGSHALSIGTATRAASGDSLRLTGGNGATFIDMQDINPGAMAFFGAVPVPQPAAATDVVAALKALGLLAAGANWPLNLGTGALTAGTTTLSGALAMGANKVTGLANGTAATDAAAFGQTPAGAFPTLHSGRWYVFPRGLASTIALIDQRLYFIPFTVDVAQSIDRLGFELTGAGSAGSTVRIGLYADDGTGEPGTLLVDGGAQATTGTGVFNVTVAQALTPGQYWIGVVGQGAPVTAPILRAPNASTNTSPLGLFAQSDAFGTGYFRTGVAGALPTPGGATGDGSVPFASVRAV